MPRKVNIQVFLKENYDACPQKTIFETSEGIPFSY